MIAIMKSVPTSSLYIFVVEHVRSQTMAVWTSAPAGTLVQHGLSLKYYRYYPGEKLVLGATSLA